MARKGKEHKPTRATREQVRMAVMAGVPVNDIADAMDLSDDTLRKHYRVEIKTARQTLLQDATKTLHEATLDGNVDAAKFIMARVGRWVERSEVDHSSTDGTLAQPVRIVLEAAPAPAPAPSIPALSAPPEQEPTR